ncbi:MAG: hypothetical protein J0M13_04110 [Candidatus Accumulibacter sp.]|nr:hypothetical protein [Candidatus Accumulibacter necessarius]
MAVLHHTGQPQAVTRCAPDDPTWLIHRVIQTDIDGPPGRGFFTLAENHPA